MHERVGVPAGDRRVRQPAVTRARGPLQRVLDLQRSIGNRAVTAMLARVPIEGLGVDTEKDELAVVKNALMGKWSKFLGFTVTLSAEEAQALLALLQGDLDEDVVAELKDLARSSDEEKPDTDDGSDDDESPSRPPKEKEKEERKEKKEEERKEEEEESVSSSEEELPAAFSSLSFGKKKKTAASGPVDKQDLGARAVRVMKGLGHTIFLAGGGGVTMLGSGRAIKDLDFRVELTGTWYDEEGDLLERINGAMSDEFRCKVRFNVSDVETAYTIKTIILGVEVSITRTPKVSYLSHGGSEGMPPVAMPTLSGFDLILDKAYSLIMRTERPKMCTDLFDLLFALNKTHGGFSAGCSVLRFLNAQRGTAYTVQAGRRRLHPDMLVELHGRLTELLRSDTEELEKVFEDLRALDLLKLAPTLVTEIEAIMAKSGAIKVYM
jgi:hypothetical protein